MSYNERVLYLTANHQQGKLNSTQKTLSEEVIGTSQRSSLLLPHFDAEPCLW